jgi:SAM-dependent methyltransferase
MDNSIEKLADKALQLGINLGYSQPEKSYELIRKAFLIDRNLPMSIDNNDTYVFNPDDEEIVDRCPVCHTDAKIAVPYFCAFSYRIINFRAPFSPAKLWMKCPECGNMFSYGWAKSFLHPKTEPQKTLLPRAEKKIAPANADATGLHIYCNILERTREYTNGLRYLEVGIGTGKSAAVALEFEYDVTLVEIDEETGQIVSDMLDTPVICIDFLQYQTDEKFDVIIMGDVLEHVTDPHAAMNKARELLSDGGVIWLSTPNFDSSYTRMMKFSDPMFSVVTHLTWFNKKGITALLDDCGLKITDYKVSNRYYGSMELFIVKK